MTECFKTNNFQLAFALATAGCTFDTEDCGPTINLYTLGFLRDRKIGVGKTIEEAVLEACERRIPGNVTWCFVRDEIFQKCINAWDETVEELQKADAEKRTPQFEPIDERVIMRTLCLHANNRAGFMSKIWVNAPFISTVTSKTKEVPIKDKPAPRRVTVGAGKVWQLGASKETRNKLKI
jgi:hypothetical protein